MTDHRDEHETYGHRDDKVFAELQEKVAKLTAERDEARRMACRYEASYNGVMFDNPKFSDVLAIAKEYKWDCFKEDGK